MHSGKNLQAWMRRYPRFPVAAPSGLTFQTRHNGEKRQLCEKHHVRMNGINDTGRQSCGGGRL